MSVSIGPIAQVVQRCRIIGALLALLLLLPGCSAIKLAYNNAPELSYWWLDSYLDFNEEQSRKLRAELASLQAWHRASELPAYLRSLEKLQRLAPAQVTPEQVCELRAELLTHVQTLIDQALPTAVALAPTLSDQQLDHLARQLDKRRQQWRDEWLEASPLQRQDRRVKQLAKRVDLFYGRLEEAQWTLLRASAADSVFDATLLGQESQRRHQDTLQTLRQIQRAAWDGARIQAALRALVARTLVSPDPVRRHYQDQLARETCRTLAALHNSSTPAQRQKLMDTLRDYENDARALLANGGKPGP